MRIFRFSTLPFTTILVAMFLLVVAVASTADWPVIVNQDAKLLPPDGAEGDRYGDSVAVHGDTAVIGAPFHDDVHENWGAAYVYAYEAGVWSELAKLLPASDSYLGYTLFGDSVAIHEATALIGASEDHENGYWSGSAYVFTRTGDVWTEQAKLLASDGSSWHRFGIGVALDGDTAVVGAPFTADNGYGSGSAYVFVRNAGVWTEQARLLPADNGPGDNFGENIALDGDTALISARGDADNGNESGSAYVFTRSGDLWTQQAKLLASDGAAYDDFGSSVALDSDTAMIGANEDDDDGSSSGSVYVFARTDDVWTEQAKLLASDGAQSKEFGAALALEGGIAVIGAWGDVIDAVKTGSAYVFTRSGGTWSEQAKLLATDGASWDKLGNSVALHGDTVVVGAHNSRDNGYYSGSAYVFRLCTISVIRDGLDTLISFMPDAGGFDLATGLLSELIADHDFSRAECLGTFLTSPAVDTLPGPSPGDARFYLARGLKGCVAAGYGGSSLTPDPRDDLGASSPCP